MRSLSCRATAPRSPTFAALAKSFSVVGPPTGQEACRPICEPGLGGLPAGEAVEHLLQQLGCEVLVGVLADLHHGSVGAGAEALDLLPGEIAVLRTDDAARAWMRRLHTSTSASDAAQHAGRRAAHLHVRLLPHRGELEHGVERGDLVDADVGHAQHVRDQAHGRLGQPAVVLLLRPPQQRDDGRGLLARRIVGDRGLGPGGILRREREALRADGGLVGGRT